MAYVNTIVCHLEDCAFNKNRECQHIGEISIVKIIDKEKNITRAECAIYRDATIKFVDNNKNYPDIDFIDQN